MNIDQTNHRAWAWIICLPVAALLIGCASTQPAESGGQPVATAACCEDAAAGLKTARVQATIYRLLLPADRIVELDSEHLAQDAGTAAKLRDVLDTMGATSVLYHADQVLDIAEGGEIRLGSHQPMVVGESVSASGRTSQQFQYMDVGAQMQVKRGSDDGSPIRIMLEFSSLSPSGNEVRDRSFRVDKVQMSHAGPVVAGSPIIAIGVDGTAAQDGVSAIAYICRIVLSKP